jgi:hypothetical protein
VLYEIIEFSLSPCQPLAKLEEENDDTKGLFALTSTYCTSPRLMGYAGYLPYIIKTQLIR